MIISKLSMILKFVNIKNLNSSSTSSLFSNNKNNNSNKNNILSNNLNRNINNNDIFLISLHYSVIIINIIDSFFLFLYFFEFSFSFYSFNYFLIYNIFFYSFFFLFSPSSLISLSLFYYFINSLKQNFKLTTYE